MYIVLLLVEIDAVSRTPNRLTILFLLTCAYPKCVQLRELPFIGLMTRFCGAVSRF
jgi:hypothetical protein